MLKVFVDSGSSIKQYEKELYNVEIIPLKILLGDKEYLDGEEITPQQIFDYVSQTKVLPKTAAINSAQYQDYFDKLLKE